MHPFIYRPYLLQRLSYSPSLEICGNDSPGPATTCTYTLMAQGISFMNFNRTTQSTKLNIHVNLCNKSLTKKDFNSELCVRE